MSFPEFWVVLEFFKGFERIKSISNMKKLLDMRVFFSNVLSYGKIEFISQYYMDISTHNFQFFI